MRSNVKAYVGPYNSDPISTIISNMQKAQGDFTVMTPLGFDGLARLAVVRGDPALKKTGATATQGGAAVKSFLGCMTVGSIPDSFAADIVSAMGSGGLFEVPAGTAGVFARGETPFWGAQPDGSTWETSANNKRFLMYGFKIAYAKDQFPVNGATTLNGFDYKTLPVIGGGILAPFNPQVIIGVCELAGPSSSRIYHAGAILAGKNLSCPLSPPILASAASTEGGFLSVTSLARKALGVFVPQPLNATALVVGIAGGRGELSPTAAVVVTPTPAFISQPVNGFVNSPIPGSPGRSVQVKVTNGAGTALSNAAVKITVFNNSGVNVAASGDSVNTGNDGVATFSALTVNKAGGYKLTATVVSYDGIPGG
ncbi:MAG TPA: hypothetical protein VHM25_23845, partial [Polyangiaceae bacterium]|nr:hypothetical protein [Polyangiaceae bacterium]